MSKLWIFNANAAEARRGWWGFLAFFSFVSFVAGCGLCIQLIVTREISLDQRALAVFAAAIVVFTVAGGTLITASFYLIDLAYRLTHRENPDQNSSQ